MKDSKRNSRIRLLVKRLNQQRKKQATQIDLLCNDIISAHRDFMETVKTLTFAAEFYESLIGIDDLDNIFYTSARMIRKQIPDANFAFFLSQPDSFQLYAFDCSTSQMEEANRLEQYFTNELVKSVTNVNQPCDTNELLQMGLQVRPAVLKDISATTVPIAAVGPAAGFILIYQSSYGPLDPGQIRFLSPAGRGLSRAIRALTASKQPNS